MYESFYGLSSKPFQLNPDPKFYFSSKPHRRARSYLVYGVMRGEGFIVITGEVGAGKTTIVRDLLDSLENGSVIAAHLVSTQLDAENALKLVCAAFGVPLRGAGKADMLMALEAFFITQLTQGKRCLLIVDEAQNLQHQAVEELRMLSNFQFGEQALLQTFLIGQPEFREILQGPGMLQLRQRVTARCHLGPLDEEDTKGYIEHRLKCAGATDKPVFGPGVFRAIHQHAGGIPRRINSLCDRLLLQGYLAEEVEIGLQAVEDVLAEMREENAAPAQLDGSARDAWGHLDAIRAAAAAPLNRSLDCEVENEAALAEELQRELSQITVEQLSARLLRMERSILRQERATVEILSALKRLVGTNASSASGRKPRSSVAPK